ncbi:MAG: hypothetical protein WCF92_03630 [bacterium]
MKFFTVPNVIGGFVFLMIFVAILTYLFWPLVLAFVFKKKVTELSRWSEEYPNGSTTDDFPLGIINSLVQLRVKLTGEWPKYIEKPLRVIHMLRLLDGHPNSHWKISGRALKKILEGESVPPCLAKEIILCIRHPDDLVTSP